MPHIGKVRLHNLPTHQTLLVPGYTELWTGLLLKDKTCLGITRRLYARSGLSSFRCLTVLNLHTEVMSPGFSQNAIEEGEIERAVSLIEEAFGKGVILVADRGFRRKELLDRLETDLGVEFVIRIEGKLWRFKTVKQRKDDSPLLVRVRARGWEGLLHQLAPHWPERLQRHWRDDSKDPILSEVRGGSVTVGVNGTKRLRFNVVCLTPVNRPGMEPMLLATTLPIETREDLSKIVSLYSKRWAIETFFATFKQSLGAGDFRVFSRWEAIDRLLAMAHMALLILVMLYVLGQAAARGVWARMWRWAAERLRTRDARPPELTLGKFFEVLADDFAQRRGAGAAP